MLCPLWVVSRRSKLYHPNGKLRDELLNGEIFYILREVQVIIEHWRNHTTRGDHTVRWVIVPQHLKWSYLRKLLMNCNLADRPPRLTQQLDQLMQGGQCDKFVTNTIFVSSIRLEK